MGKELSKGLTNTEALLFPLLGVLVLAAVPFLCLTIYREKRNAKRDRLNYNAGVRRVYRLSNR